MRGSLLVYLQNNIRMLTQEYIEQPSAISESNPHVILLCDALERILSYVSGIDSYISSLLTHIPSGNCQASILEDRGSDFGG